MRTKDNPAPVFDNDFLNEKIPIYFEHPITIQISNTPTNSEYFDPLLSVDL